MKTSAQKKQEEHETSVVEGMSAAQAHAERLFGTQVNTFAVHEIFDYLVDADEDEFFIDLERVIGYAKLAHKTTAPTPEQVFGLFERIFETED